MSLKLRICAAGLLIFTLAFVWSFGYTHFRMASPAPKSTHSAAANDAAPRDLVNLPLPAPRKIYPYSVIPGGVASIEELKSAIAIDPALAEHLKDFNLETARIVQVTDDHRVYVSYRKGSKFYWTSRPVKLARGEWVITDGNRTLRVRCGNDVSDFPETPTVIEEPNDTELDTPMPALEPNNIPLSDPLLDPSNVYAFASSFTGLPPAYRQSSDSWLPPITPGLDLPGGGTPKNPPSDPPIPTPEPSSLLMLLAGAAGIGAARFRRPRK